MPLMLYWTRRGLIVAWNKQVTLRPLDKLRLKEERTQWQLLSILGPLALIGLIGRLWQLNRKRKYGNNKI
ncbi:MAG: hypothetical protein R2822_03270 [Spirosomataceae bacterium]